MLRSAVVSSGVFASVALAQTAPVVYQGRLDQGGEAYTGLADFRFSMYNAVEGGLLMSGPFEADGISVVDGLFNAELEFEHDGAVGIARWLEIEARVPAGSGVFETLSPRQRLSEAPVAAQARGAQVQPDGSVVVQRSIDFTWAVDHRGATGEHRLVQRVTQTFVPTVSGTLYEAYLYDEIVLGDAYTIDVFEGAGTGGSHIDYTSEINGFNTFQNQAKVLAGTTYTLEYVVFDEGTGLPGGANIEVSTGDTYPDGTSDLAPGEDLRFGIAIKAPGTARTMFTADFGLYVSGSSQVDGDVSVDLPSEAINPDEMLGEPGVASATGGDGTVDSTTPKVILSRGINCPTDGFVLALATFEFAYSHTNGTNSLYEFGISNGGTVFPTNQDVQFAWPPTRPRRPTGRV